MLKLAGETLNGRTGHEAGRELLGRMYREATGEKLPEIAVADRGKPYFVTGNLHFSISHTKNRVFCALSDKPVGLDAEEMDREMNLRLAEKILSESEKRRWEASADKRAALLRLWVLKEAAVKLTGEGLRGYPCHTDFDPNDPRITELDGCYVAVLEMQNDECKMPNKGVSFADY